MDNLREKISQLAKGIFEYELPKFVLSDELIIVSVQEGQNFNGSFKISNDRKSSIKGIVYSPNELLKIDNCNFFGTENVIEYEIMTSKLGEGEGISGDIHIISDMGEIEIPYLCEIELPYCMTSLGKIKDLFQFANLAKSDWEEALQLFKSDEFERVFLYKDYKNKILFNNLIEGSSIAEALEEFLIAIHKKLKINLSINKSNVEFDKIDEPIMDTILITKDNWGYTNIGVTTDASFIELVKKTIGLTDFLSNTCELEYIVNPEKMRPGNNYGTVFLKTLYQVMTVQVTCKHGNRDNEDKYNYREIKRCKEKITENYIEFRKHKIKPEKYIVENEVLLQKASTLESNNNWNQLIRIHLSIISNDLDKAKKMLEEFNLNQEPEKDVESYCGYLYLKALHSKDEAVIEDVAEIITNYANNGYKSLPVIWSLLYLDKRYENKGNKLKLLREQFELGCRSPILYYEVYSILKEDTSLLSELNSFEIQVMNWIIKSKLITSDIALQFICLAGREKGFRTIVYQSLKTLYEEYQTKDILMVICGILIKGHKTSNKYFYWYQLGVKAQLRIAELHEYYMYSIDESTMIELDQPILLYFIYNSNLGDKKRGFLYANIIKNKEKNPVIYRNYRKSIEEYAYKQIRLHNINYNLSVIYEEVINTEELCKEVGKDIPYIMFQYELCCVNPNMKGVLVVHKETKDEIYYPLLHGKAQISLYTENPYIYIVDICDNRYISSVEYTLNRFIEADKYVNKCMEYNSYNHMLLLNASDKAYEYQKKDTSSIEIRKRALTIKELRSNYINKYTKSLINYYYDNYESVLLELYLKEININQLDGEDRNKMVEHFIIRGLYDKAKQALLDFGYKGILIKRLVRLCTTLIKESNPSCKDDFLLSLSFYIFTKDKYDETILKYLLDFYEGTTKDMFNIFIAARNKACVTDQFEEKLLGQILFTEAYSVNLSEVFNSYYNKKHDPVIINAFLSYHAYKYLLHDRILEKELFTIMKKELSYKENNITMLALLKYYSSYDNLSKEDYELVDFNIKRFMDKGIVLPFFKDFKDRIDIPEEIRNKYYVEYKTNPNNKVNINYIIDTECSGDEFKSDEMQNVFMGIFVKEFIVFYDEQLKYYIIENDGQEESITESFNYKLDNMIEDDNETKFNQLNLMLITKDMGDNKTLLEMMKSYEQTIYLSSELFKPML